MDVLRKQPRETQAVIGGALLFVIISFFDWQHFSADTPLGDIDAGFSLWRGIGVIAALLAIALLVWEAVRLFQVKLDLGTLSPGLVSVTLALLLLVFTVLTFISHNEGRYWPAWVGLILSIVIAVAAWMRAKAEGVQMPDMTAARASRSSEAAPPAPGTPGTTPPPASPARPATPPDREPPTAV